MPASLQDLINTFGYAAVLVGTFLEGETVLILGGVAARLQYLKLEWVIAVAFVGSLLGDQLWFFLGRRYGRRLLARHPAWQAKAEKIHRMLDRFETAVLIGFRFLYGFRNLTPFVVGMSRVGRAKFLILNVVGALIWSVSGAILGYVFAHTVDLLLGDIKRYELEVMVFVVIVALIVWGACFLRKKLHDRPSSHGNG